MTEKKFIQCMHCGVKLFARKNESYEQHHDRFLRKHILVMHLTQMAQIDILERKGKLPN